MSEPMIQGERVLSGPEKAAALLLIMGKPPAARLLKHFDPPDLRAVARAAAGLGAVAPTTLDCLVEEFATDFSAGANLLGDVGQARNLLAEALPPNEVDDVLDSALGEGKELDVWQALGRTPETAIIAFLVAERPATATYLLSKLDPPLAARIASALPRERRNAALCGLVSPCEVTPLAAQLVETALRGMLSTARAPGGGNEGRSRIAGIINNLDPDEAEDVMRAIARARPKDATILKTMLFGFNDLPKLSERARALLFDRASIDIVVMALRGTEPDFRNAILSSMPSRGRRLVEGELASSASAPARDIAKARKAIADIVLGMASRNEIELGGSPVDDAA
ncbi:MAG: flagellar motor switch protein FliG [Hyphomicrobiales bacterium]|nr:flagellar motor switch protein FliG [Hyphomicrobiales bacterium]MBV8441372.1 flagellar motor switch protein FliG [Hyphomicrobiales bacterium]